MKKSLDFIATTLSIPLAIGAVWVETGLAENIGNVRITVNAASSVRTMRGGIGASWHAIEKPIANAPDGQRQGGSAWGANPPAANEKAWRDIYRHAEWLGLDWCRVEFSQRMYEPQRGQFDFDNPEMRILYRILDWCERHKVDVFFQQMWGNVAWNTFPQWRNTFRQTRSGPLSVDDYAEGLATLVEHMVKHKGYTCIRWLSITNEPPYWLRMPRKNPKQSQREYDTMSLTPILAAVRKALDSKGLGVPLSAPDRVPIPPLVPDEIDYDHLVGAYDMHTYLSHLDGHTEGYMSKAYDPSPFKWALPILTYEQRMFDWAHWAHQHGKPFFLTEVGSLIFGWDGDTPNPSSYEAVLKDSEEVIRGITAGVDGFNRWSFINRGDLDGQWQFIDTWDRKSKTLLDYFTPHPNSYFVFGLLPRFIAKHPDVLKCNVKGGVGVIGKPDDAYQHVFAAALKNPSGNLTFAVVNDAEDADWNLAFEVRGLDRETQLHRYRMTPAQRDRADMRVDPDREITLTKPTTQFRDRLPAASLTIYTTYKLTHDDPGIMTEEPGGQTPTAPTKVNSQQREATK